MSAVERAAEVIQANGGWWNPEGAPGPRAARIAQALVDAGLLVTDELQAEADRAVADLRAANAELLGVIRALRIFIPEWATNARRWLDALVARNSFDDDEDD